MQARQIQILGLHGRVQPTKDKPDPRRELSRDPRFRAADKVPLQTSVFEALNHSENCNVLRYGLQ